MDHVHRCIQSPRAVDRKAAITAVTVISEGCADRVAEQIEQIMPWVIAGLQDESMVRQASLVAISELAKNLCDNVVPYHEEIVPLLLAGTKDSEDLICIKSFYAISHYIGIEPEVVLPHLEVILNHLMPGLNHGNLEVKELALNALSACVSMAQERFEPYFEQTMHIMKEWMAITDPDLLIIRGRATECVSMLAGAVRKELFMPYFESVVTLVVSGLESVDDAELREFIYRFFGQIANAYSEKLSPVYPTVIPYLLASCQSSEGLVCVNDDDSLQMFPQEGPELNSEVTIRVLPSYMDEKAAAVSCLGWMIAENPDASASFLEVAFQITV